MQTADSHDFIRVRGAAGQQSQGRRRRDRETPADRLHRGVRFGEELAGVRHDRRGIAAAHQRDVQHLRPGLHADAGHDPTSTCSRADDGDHRRPGADGFQPPLDRRHRHRRQRHAADPVQPPRATPDRFTAGVLVQRRHHQRIGGGDVEKGGKTTRRSVRSPGPAECARSRLDAVATRPARSTTPPSRSRTER